jgi:hypothetical protein
VNCRHPGAQQRGRCCGILRGVISLRPLLLERGSIPIVSLRTAAPPHPLSQHKPRDRGRATAAPIIPPTPTTGLDPGGKNSRSGRLGDTAAPNVPPTPALFTAVKTPDQAGSERPRLPSSRRRRRPGWLLDRPPTLEDGPARMGTRPQVTLDHAGPVRLFDLALSSRCSE